MRNEAMLPPSHIGRSPEEIASKTLHFDSAGYLYRAVSWLDYYKRSKNFPALLYASIEGRMAVEYLLFELLVIGTSAQLTLEEYKKCLKDRTKLDKAISRLVPNYEKVQEFSALLIEFEPALPKHLKWNIKDLKKDWGVLSEYLHWLGAANLTAEKDAWCATAYEELRSILQPLWEKLSSGQSMMMPPGNMTHEVREVWEDFSVGKVDSDSARIRLRILKPVLNAKYA
jgi:hypothetical protein